MGFFGSSKQKEKEGSSNTGIVTRTGFTGEASSRNHIGKGTFVDGEIECEGDIRIDGKLHGYLNSKSKVVIGDTGEIKGDIVCNNADISGHIEGTIKVREVLFLQSTAVIKGDIITQKLVIDSGAVFNGSCTMPEDGKVDFDAKPMARTKSKPAPSASNKSKKDGSKGQTTSK
ncbi:MAG: bactofilin family protein [Chitinophagales bacterium]